MREIRGIVVHCAATPSTMDIGKAEIDRWHRQQGWLGIGYHFVIRRNGTVETGRPLEQAGAHVKGHNRHTIGICMAGGTAADRHTPELNFTEPQYVALWGIIKQLKGQWPHAKLYGHSDLDTHKPHCPGFDVTEWWSEWEDAPKIGGLQCSRPQ